LTRLLKKTKTGQLAEPLEQKIALAICADEGWKKNAFLYAKNNLINQNHLLEIINKLEWHAVASRSLWYIVSRRLFDIILAALLLVLCLPIMLALAVIIKLTSPGPVIYTQLRIGQYMKPFWLFKFRTMNEQTVDGNYQSSSEPLARPLADQRSTSIGSFMRRWSLDELPQLVNALIGDMSLVGPRPLTVDDSAATPDDRTLRYAVRPGLSGLWQVTARHTNDGKLKLTLDCEYVRLRSWRVDLWIMWRTIGAIIQAPE